MGYVVCISAAFGNEPYSPKGKFISRAQGEQFSPNGTQNEREISLNGAVDEW
jgi:hypothetical protein